MELSHTHTGERSRRPLGSVCAWALAMQCAYVQLHQQQEEGAAMQGSAPLAAMLACQPHVRP
jgi:hypothetical protein